MVLTIQERLKDISHYAFIKLAKFYGVTADYLLGLTRIVQKSELAKSYVPQRGKRK